MDPDDADHTAAPFGARDVRGSDRPVPNPDETGTTTSPPVGVRDVRSSALPGGSTPRPSVVAVGSGRLSGDHEGGSIAQRVAERRRGMTTARAADATSGTESAQASEPEAVPPAEGLTVNFLATQLLDLQTKFKAQEVELMETRRIMEMQRGKIVQLEERTSAPASAFDRMERDAARLLHSAPQSEQGDTTRTQEAAERREQEREQEAEREAQRARQIIERERQEAAERDEQTRRTREDAERQMQELERRRREAEQAEWWKREQSDDQRKIERRLEKQREAQKEVEAAQAALDAAMHDRSDTTAKKARLDAARKEAESQTAKLRKEVEASQKAARRRSPSPDSDSEGEPASAGGAKRSAQDQFYVKMLEKLEKGKSGTVAAFGDLKPAAFSGPLPAYRAPGSRPLSQLDYTFEWEDELAHELKKSYPYDARNLITYVFDKARTQHAKYVRELRSSPTLREGEYGRSVKSEEASTAGTRSRREGRGERRRVAMDRDDSGLLATFVPTRDRDDLTSETRRVREEWIENQIVRELMKALPDTVVKKTKAMVGRDPWASALIFTLLTFIYADVDTQRKEIQDELLEIKQKSGETVSEMVTRWENLLDVFDDWSVTLPDLDRMKVPLLAAVEARAEKLPEQERWEWKFWYSKVKHRGWRGTDYSPLYDVLATAEDVFQKFPTDQEQSVRKAANLGQADQLCTFCWKGKHSIEACNHKKSGGKQLPKPEHLKTARAQERAKRERERKDRANSGGAGEKPPCTWCQKPGHTEEECYAKRDGKPKVKEVPTGKGGGRRQGDQPGKQGTRIEPRRGDVPLAEVQCFKCKKFGHYQSDCPDLQAEDPSAAAKDAEKKRKEKEKRAAKTAEKRMYEAAGRKALEAAAKTEEKSEQQPASAPVELTSVQLGLPEPVNDIQRYIVSSMTAMANAQAKSQRKSGMMAWRAKDSSTPEDAQGDPEGTVDREAEGNSAERGYTVDTGATDVFANATAADQCVSKVDVAITNGLSTDVCENQHGELMVDGTQLLPPGVAAQQNLRSFIWTQGETAPVFDNIDDPKDLATLREIAAKYRHTEVRGAIPVVSESVGLELREELSAKRRGEQRSGLFSMGMRVGSQRTPKVCNKIFEADYTPKWMHALVSKQQTAGWTHVRFDTQPDYAMVPWNISVARTREGIGKDQWAPDRKLIVLERVQGLDGVFEYKAEVDAPMHGAGSKGASPALSKLVAELPPVYVVISLFKRLAAVPDGDEATTPFVDVCDAPPIQTAQPREDAMNTPAKVTSEERAHATSDVGATPATDAATRGTTDVRADPCAPCEFFRLDDGDEVREVVEAEDSFTWELSEGETLGEPFTAPSSVVESAAAFAGERADGAVEKQWKDACMRAAEILSSDLNEREAAHVRVCGVCGYVGRESCEPECAEAHKAKKTQKQQKAERKNRAGIQPRVLPPCDETDNPHRDGKHDHHDSTCATCQEANMHSRSKRRGAASQEVGGFAIDIAVRTTDGSPAQGTLIAASTGDHRKIAVGKGIVSKTAAVLFATLMKVLLVAELVWGAAPIKRVHSDREPGIVSSEAKINENAVALTTTEGHSSASNAVAESAINVVSQGARVSLAQCVANIEDPESKKAASTFLWHYAMEYNAALWSAMEVERAAEAAAKGEVEKVGKDAVHLRDAKVGMKDFLPFGAIVLYREGHKVKPQKDEPTGKRAIYLGPNFDVSLGSTVMDLHAPYRVRPTTTVQLVLRDGQPQFPTTLHLPEEEEGEFAGDWVGSVWIECTKCGKWRLVDAEIAEQYSGGTEFHCKMLEGVTCRSKEDPRAWDDDATRRVSGKDKKPKPEKLQRTAKLAKLLGVKPEQFEDRHSEAFLSLLDYANSEDAIHADQDAEHESDEPVELDVEWTCVQRGADRVAGMQATALRSSARVDWRQCSCMCAVSDDVPELGGRQCQNMFVVTEETQFDLMCSMCKGGCVCQCQKIGTPKQCQASDTTSPASVCEPCARPAEPASNVRTPSAELLQQCAEHSAHVVKVMALKEAKLKRPKYHETVAAEVGRHMEFATYGKPVPRSSVPIYAVIYRGKMIYGIKHWETPELHKDKARLVVQGCIRITKAGKVILEKHFKRPGEFWAPSSSMAGFRFICAVAAIFGLDVETIDLDSAYLQSYVTEEFYLMFDDALVECMPEDWQAAVRAAKQADISMGGTGEVCYPALKNIYGKTNAGTNFINAFQNSLLFDGWERLPHDFAMMVQFCSTEKIPQLLSNYVDDISAMLTSSSRSGVWSNIRKLWKFDDSRLASLFLGIVRKVSECKRYCELSQSDYMSNVVAKYEAATGKTIAARTTLPDREPVTPDPDYKRESGTIVRSGVGGVAYGARGTRPDLAKANNVIARRVTTWDESMTIFLEHLLGYIKGTLNVVLVLDARGGPRDLSEWIGDVSADADYRSPFCYSGIVISLFPRRAPTSANAFLPIDFTCSGQRYVKLSPAESEGVSAAHAMRAGQHYAASLEVLQGLEEPLPFRQREDNTQCILLLERGWSAALAHVPRVYGVSVLWCAERIREKRVIMAHEGSASMIADPLTKLTQPRVLFERGILARAKL